MTTDATYNININDYEDLIKSNLEKPKALNNNIMSIYINKCTQGSVDK